MSQIRNIKLVLNDGKTFDGFSFGYEGSTAGEVVFNTAMTGYPESLTDPSYKNQILVLTYPLVGNYGVPNENVKDKMFEFYESEEIQVSGLIISEYSKEYSHWNAEQSLADWLKKYKVPGIFGIDTRELTMHLRENGSQLGKIVFEDQEVETYDPNLENQVDKVSIKEKEVYGEGDHKIVLIDCGVKNNIIRHLLKRNTTVIRVPWDYDFLNEDYDGLFISNGPGNPEFCAKTVENIKKSFEQDKPIFGICMGNQLMGLAAGAKTYKLKYGHRSHNQPVLLCGTNKSYVTSQNHGYAIDNEYLKGDWEPLFINLNDNTNEGMVHKTKPFFSTQFHPEASSGPTDTDFLFDKFIENIEEYKK
jgi:carbamoyl-phosphate synthase small subunit